MKAILFDFGGTIDTNGVHWSEMFWTYHQRRNHRTGKTEFERAFVRSDEMLAAEPDIARLDLATMLRRQFRFQFELLGVRDPEGLATVAAAECRTDVLAIVGRAAPLLRACCGAYRLAVVSNFYGNLDGILRELGIGECFEAAVDSAIVGVKKPDPSIFALALGRLGVNASEAYVVGDSYERDIVPAKSLGCTTIWLKGPSWSAPAETTAADYTITSLEAMKAIVLP